MHGRRFGAIFLLLFVLATTLTLTRATWLGALGAILIQADEPVRADCAVVLAGDLYGHRILRAAELARQGYVPRVIVSGPVDCYGVNESDLAVAFAVRHGYPESYFIKVPVMAHSTRDEAWALAPELRRWNAHRVLVVTSDFHTRRARRRFHEAVPDLDVRMVAAPDEFFRWNSWWRNREAQKVFCLEWTKTIASVFGI